MRVIYGHGNLCVCNCWVYLTRLCQAFAGRSSSHLLYTCCNWVSGNHPVESLTVLYTITQLRLPSGCLNQGQTHDMLNILLRVLKTCPLRPLYNLSDDAHSTLTFIVCLPQTGVNAVCLEQPPWTIARTLWSTLFIAPLLSIILAVAFVVEETVVRVSFSGCLIHVCGFWVWLGAYLHVLCSWIFFDRIE